MNFLLPQGIGDAIWALHKVQDIARDYGERRIDIFLNCSEPNGPESRALEFVRRFNFVTTAQMLRVNIMRDPLIDDEGRYNYINDGWMPEMPGVFALMPNQPLERGIRLEEWLPDYQTNWAIVNDFNFADAEREVAETMRERCGSYIVFFMGSLIANTVDGHNRCERWTPFEWIELGDWLHETLGLEIVVVGAEYDATYFESRIAPNVEGKSHWHNLIGQFSIWETFAVCRQARMVISYQSGIGIFSSYTGVPTGIFWRAKGDSIREDVCLSFEESMASAWANPKHIGAGKHLPLIYGRHGTDYIRQQIIERNW